MSTGNFWGVVLFWIIIVALIISSMTLIIVSITTKNWLLFVGTISGDLAFISGWKMKAKKDDLNC